ncbi:hypothetical protein P4O66_004492 [Electrophorus voltai]|uniref:Uncharacterized protein n=1 Tax=Electrophorus voltai TaxID=2609070 RepID=A0AAD8YNP7_9TELE|nr:hypothetical protein P4O66_004492 [Electrophorus voltai]
MSPPGARLPASPGRIPLVRTSSKPAARRRPRHRAGLDPAGALTADAPSQPREGGKGKRRGQRRVTRRGVPTRTVAGGDPREGPGARPESPPQHRSPPLARPAVRRGAWRCPDGTLARPRVPGPAPDRPRGRQGGERGTVGTTRGKRHRAPRFQAGGGTARRRDGRSPSRGSVPAPLRTPARPTQPLEPILIPKLRI